MNLTDLFILIFLCFVFTPLAILSWIVFLKPQTTPRLSAADEQKSIEYQQRKQRTLHTSKPLPIDTDLDANKTFVEETKSADVDDSNPPLSPQSHESEKSESIVADVPIPPITENIVEVESKHSFTAPLSSHRQIIKGIIDFAIPLYTRSIFQTIWQSAINNATDSPIADKLSNPVFVEIRTQLFSGHIRNVLILLDQLPLTVLNQNIVKDVCNYLSQKERACARSLRSLQTDECDLENLFNVHNQYFYRIKKHGQPGLDWLEKLDTEKASIVPEIVSAVIYQPKHSWRPYLTVLCHKYELGAASNFLLTYYEPLVANCLRTRLRCIPHIAVDFTLAEFVAEVDNLKIRYSAHNKFVSFRQNLITSMHKTRDDACELVVELQNITNAELDNLYQQYFRLVLRYRYLENPAGTYQKHVKKFIFARADGNLHLLFREIFKPVHKDSISLATNITVAILEHYDKFVTKWFAKRVVPNNSVRK